MSEYEMAYLQNEYLTTALMALGVLFTLVSGFLVMSFAAAHKLTPFMITVAISLFSIWMLAIESATVRSVINAMGMNGEIHAAMLAGKGFKWHAVSSVYAPEVAAVLLWAGRAAMLLTYLAAIAFFFHCRRVNRKAEVGAWKPKA